MPRIKAPPQPAVPSLDGVTISFASYTANAHPELGNKTVSQLKKDISDCGGAYTTKPSDCTHMIASQAQFDKKIDRIKQTEKHPNASIVSYEWLADSLASSTPIDVDAYLLAKPDDSSSNGVDTLSGNRSQAPRKASAAKKASKRARQQDDDEEDDLVPPKKSKQSGPTKSSAPTAATNAKSAIKVPVDQQVPSASSYTVHIDDDGVIYDATLNKSDAGENNNKFYRAQVLRSNDVFKTWTRWGRVGERGQNKWLGDGDASFAIAQFKAKFREKSGIAWEVRDGPSKKGKYVYLEVNYEDSDEEDEKATPVPDQDDDADADEEDHVFAPSKLDEPVQRLMELIFNVQYFNATMAELDYDANKMPLGKLSKKTLLKGYEVLKELASLVADPTLAVTMGENQNEAVADRSNQYFSLVPHVVGRRKVPVLRDMDSIRVTSHPLLFPRGGSGSH
jgi:poly [ADP-ribose] polymerase